MARNFAVKKVRKQMYPATYNFRDEKDGNTGLEIAFINGFYAAAADGYAKIIASLDGHRKVLELFDNSPAGTTNIIHDFTTQDGTGITIEFWHRTEDNTQTLDIVFYDGAVIAIRLDLNSVAGIGDDTWYHWKFILDTDADTYDYYIDSVLTGNGVAFDNVVPHVNRLQFFTAFGAQNTSHFLDAIGYSWDPAYTVGDNVYWRHYTDQDSDFESEDVGTTGTSIGWVDVIGAGYTAEIIEEFNEHKKVIKSTRTGAYADYPYNSINQVSGTIEFWMYSVVDTAEFLLSDETPTSVVIIDYDGVNNEVDVFYSVAGKATVAVSGSWVHIKIYFDCTTDKQSVWVNNVLVVDNENFYLDANIASITRVALANGAGDNGYYDAFSYSWTTGNEVADNRIFDYNDAYTREDITTLVENVIQTNLIFDWRRGTLFSETLYDPAEIFFQIYDINSKLGMEADIWTKRQIRGLYLYTLLDKNSDDLANLSSNTFSNAKIHDPTDSSSILKTLLPNVSEADGDLILVNADTKTDTYSMVTKNYPDGDALRDVSDLGDSVVIIEANGKCHLDDDLASGDSLDVDNVSDKDQMTAVPIPKDITGINYWEVFGAVNMDTGERFFKITDNSGTNKKRKWRITNNSFRNQTDVDNYAAKLVSKVIAVKEITIAVQGFGAHNMGETFDYKYVDVVFNIPQANYYVISEEINYDKAQSTLILSEGLLEISKYASSYERPQNYSDAYATEIYETDLIPLVIPGWTLLGSTQAQWFVVIANNQGVIYNVTTDEKLDISRDIVIKVPFKRIDAGGDTISIEVYLDYWELDGSAKTFVWAGIADTLPAGAVNRFGEKEFIIPAGTLPASASVDFYFVIKEAGKSIWAHPISYRFFQKRSV